MRPRISTGYTDARGGGAAPVPRSLDIVLTPAGEDGLEAGAHRFT